MVDFVLSYYVNFIINISSTIILIILVNVKDVALQVLSVMDWLLQPNHINTFLFFLSLILSSFFSYTILNLIIVWGLLLVCTWTLRVKSFCIFNCISWADWAHLSLFLLLVGPHVRKSVRGSQIGQLWSLIYVQLGLST